MAFDPRIGWSLTTLTAAAEEEYGDVIKEIRMA